MELICEFCQKSFNTEGILKNHQKTAKYCLEKQNKTIDNIYKCKGCEKLFSQKSNLSRHEKGCIYIVINQVEELKKQLNEKDVEITSLKEQVISYRSQIELYKQDKDLVHKLALQPKNNTTTNITNNLGILNIDKFTKNVESALENIHPYDLLEGQKSIARIVAPCFTESDGTKLISCADVARSIFSYKDNSGSVIRDPQCQKLAKTIEPLASKKATELIIKDYKRKEKSNRLKDLKLEIQLNEEKIEELEEHQRGYKRDSSHFKRLENDIEKLYDDNNDKYEEIKLLEEQGITPGNDDVCDERLIEAEEDIKLMKNDSKKFAKELVNHI